MDPLKQHRYVSLAGPLGRQWVTAIADLAALSAAEYEGWPLAPRLPTHPLRTRVPVAAMRARSRGASRD